MIGVDHVFIRKSFLQLDLNDSHHRDPEDARDPIEAPVCPYAPSSVPDSDTSIGSFLSSRTSIRLVQEFADAFHK